MKSASGGCDDVNRKRAAHREKLRNGCKEQTEAGKREPAQNGDTRHAPSIHPVRERFI
jgi:hypothetical protein